MKYSTMIKQLKLRHEKLAVERDKLVDLQGEVDDLLDVCERATESLDDAIAALSELV